MTTDITGGHLPICPCGTRKVQVGLMRYGGPGVAGTALFGCPHCDSPCPVPPDACGPCRRLGKHAS